MAVVFFVWFVFGTVALSALLYGRRVVPLRLRGVFTEAAEAQGCFRIAGLLVYAGFVVVLPQALLVGALLGRNGPLEPPMLILILMELAAAVAWTYFWARRCLRIVRAATS